MQARIARRHVPENHWPRIAVMGAGAVGCYFGGMLARAGAPVTLIGRPHRVEAIARQGLYIDSPQFHERIAISASPNAGAAGDAGLVLFCVKSFDTEEAAKSLAAHLAPGAAVLSMQNGVDNADRIRSATGIAAIPAVVYVAVSMTAPNRVRHSGRGDLVIGNPSGALDLTEIAALFVRAGIPCRISENIQADLWVKMIMNCAYNAISALARSKYGRIVRNPWTRDLMRTVTREALHVARAAGVGLPDSEVTDAVLQLAEAMSEATSSTAQDIARGSRTEVDALNGYLVRRGCELGVATPVNQTLFALVKLLEETARERLP